METYYDVVDENTRSFLKYKACQFKYLFETIRFTQFYLCGKFDKSKIKLKYGMLHLVKFDYKEYQHNNLDLKKNISQALVLSHLTFMG